MLFICMKLNFFLGAGQNERLSIFAASCLILTIFYINIVYKYFINAHFAHKCSKFVNQLNFFVDEFNTQNIIIMHY